MRFSFTDGQKRNMSNFVEFATLQYLTSSQYIDQAELNDILNDKPLVENLNSGLQDNDIPLQTLL
jgi:hypothetical protein